MQHEANFCTGERTNGRLNQFIFTTVTAQFDSEGPNPRLLKTNRRSTVSQKNLVLEDSATVGLSIQLRVPSHEQIFDNALVLTLLSVNL